MKVDGATVTITTLVAGSVDGECTLTVPAFATADVVLLQLFDSVLNASIINLDGSLYKSNVATTVVV